MMKKVRYPGPSRQPARRAQKVKKSKGMMIITTEEGTRNRRRKKA